MKDIEITGRLEFPKDPTLQCVIAAALTQTASIFMSSSWGMNYNDAKIQTIGIYLDMLNTIKLISSCPEESNLQS